KVGENVLIVHSQANRDSRPHLIGGHGDYVWETGKFSNTPETGLETWFIRGGSAGAAMYKFLQPGIYAYVTHNLIEAAELGATAEPAVIELKAGGAPYRVAGDFTRAGKSAEAPLIRLSLAEPLAIMQRQVSSAEFQACVADGACHALDRDVVVANDLPAVQVS